MQPNKFSEKTCWITGASSGIGAALAVALNRLGAYVILSARNKDNLEKVRSACAYPDKAVVLVCNMEETALLQETATRAWKTFSGLDYVFLNAGFAVRDMIITTELELIKQVMNVNFLGNVVISKTLLPLMKEKGSGCFVVTSSLSGKYGVPKLAAYAASKHALHGFFESLRAEYEPDGIQATMIIPGLVKTNISVNALKGDGKTYGRMQESIANGITPEHCAKGIIKAVAAGRNEAVVGGMEKYSVMIKRFFPAFLTAVIGKHPFRKLRKLGMFKSKQA